MPSFFEISPVVLEKKNFEGFLPYKGMVAILVMCPGLLRNKLVPPSYRLMLHIKFGFDWPSGFREEDL